MGLIMMVPSTIPNHREAMNFPDTSGQGQAHGDSQKNQEQEVYPIPRESCVLVLYW